MSGRATGWVLAHGPAPTDVDRDGLVYGLARARAMRAVLLTIADAANADGEHAHPGREAMVSGSLYSLATVARILVDLRTEGWIEVEEEGGGRGRAAVYRVVMAKPARDETLSPPETVSSEAETVSSNPGKPSRFGPKPSRLDETPTVSNNGTTSTVSHNDAPAPPTLALDPPPPTFETFWRAYPRRVGRAAAQRAWRTATRKVRPELILAGATRYAAEKRGCDPQYIAHPSTWLNGERWGDEPVRTPATSRSTRWTPPPDEEQAARAAPSGEVDPEEVWS